MTRTADLASGAACTVLGMVAAAALLYTMDGAPAPVPTVTVTAPSWADGCTTDADCAAWEAQRTIDPQPTLPESCDVTMEGDEAGYFPCTEHPIESITGPGGDLHNACWVVSTSAEDSLAVCADGTEWPS